jgi:hypothetical protein
VKIGGAIAGRNLDMDAALLSPNVPAGMTTPFASRIVPAAEFRRLLVSHRRMVRVDRKDQRLRGLQDLDTGEVFLTDERRLLETAR